MEDSTKRVDRRRALAVMGGLAGSVAAPALAEAALAPSGLLVPSRRGILLAADQRTSGSGLPISKINDILPGAKHVTSTGVLVISFGRKDLAPFTGPGGIPFRTSFQIDTAFFFQPLPNNQAMVNGAMALLPKEIDPVIDRILSNGLVFQAEHQHFYELKPMVFFVHLRGKGDPIDLAHRLRKTLSATGTPLNQKSSKQPKPPFDLARLEHILGGKGMVSADGVITVMVRRRGRIRLGGVEVNPDLNVLTKVEFEPIPSHFGGPAAASPDFAMTADEVDPVMKTMRRQGWKITCLYNQETDEKPQLFYSHQLKVGDPYKLAQEVRKGLDQTASHGTPQMGSSSSR